MVAFLDIEGNRIVPSLKSLLLNNMNSFDF